MAINTYEPKTPPAMATPQSAIKNAMACHSDFLLTIPAIIEVRTLFSTYKI